MTDLRRLGLGLAGAGLVAVSIFLAEPPGGSRNLDPARRGSLRIEDRSGRLLREAPVGGERARWIGARELPSWVIDAIVAAEDRRFRWHPGVDLLAVMRAAGQNVTAGRTISGGSTISMQLVRLLDQEGGRPTRSFGSKIHEAGNALRLELRLGKQRVLEQYLNRTAFGRGAVGIEAASRAWFGHSARQLTPGEAAWLAILPRGPARLGRDDALARLESRRQHLLDRLAGRPGFSGGELDRARLAPETVTRESPPFEAPHLTGWLLDQLPPERRHRAGVLRTTLDLDLQHECERAVQVRLRQLQGRGARQAAVVIIDNATGEIRALVGSPDFRSEEAGQVNGALARRQPGSTLKPFTYALAFESGLSPASRVRDEPAAWPAVGGPFVPRNYGGLTFGPVRIREALGSSLNVAAVDALSRVGVERLYTLLGALDLLPPEGGPRELGLGLTLGVGEVRLLDLANAYAMLARGGVHRPAVALLDARDPDGRPLPLAGAAGSRRLIDPVAAWWITDILRDDSARWRSFGRGGVLDMPWPVSVKTGTSSDWRDNWAVGYTAEWTAGVWVGDFSGRPLQRVSGVWGAAPLLRDLFARLAERGPLTSPAMPRGLAPVAVCPESGEPATERCPGRIMEYFRPEGDARSPCSAHGVAPGPLVADGATGRPVESSAAPSRVGEPAVHRPTILRPVPDDIYFLDPALPVAAQSVMFEVRADRGPLEWSLDGRLLARTLASHRVAWPLGRSGRHRLVVESPEGRAEVSFVVVTGRPVERAPAEGR